MTTTLERAARAMEDRLYQMEHGGDGPDCYRRLGRSEYVELARAVLMAVREPSLEVCQAVDGYICQNERLPEFGRWVGSADNSDSFMPDEVFTAMIDAILNEDSAK